MNVQLTNLHQHHDTIASVWTEFSEEHWQRIVEPICYKESRQFEGKMWAKPGSFKVPNKIGSRCTVT